MSLGGVGRSSHGPGMREARPGAYEGTVGGRVDNSLCADRSLGADRSTSAKASADANRTLKDGSRGGLGGFKGF
jgi:hypothetical protein